MDFSKLKKLFTRLPEQMEMFRPDHTVRCKPIDDQPKDVVDPCRGQIKSEPVLNNDLLIDHHFILAPMRQELEYISRWHTRESIMDVLGLDHNFQGVPGAPPGRQIGRTTQMLIKAAVALQHGRVCVVGYTGSYTRDLNQKLEQICSQTGIETSRLIKIYDGHYGNVLQALARYGYRPNEAHVFLDHYRGCDHRRGMVVDQIIVDDLFAPGISADLQRQLDASLRHLHLQMNETVPSPPTSPTLYEMLGIDEKCSKCKYCSGSRALRCAPYPMGDVSGCPHFEAK